jgi:hypothetical protein
VVDAAAETGQWVRIAEREAGKGLVTMPVGAMQREDGERLISGGRN